MPHLTKTTALVHGRPLIRVSAGKKLTGGRRIQRYFRKQGAANDYIKKTIALWRQQGAEAFLLTFDQRHQAVVCFQKLAPYKVTLVDAVETFIEEHCVRTSGKTVDEVGPEFLKSCRRTNLKIRTIAQYASDISIFSETFGSSQMWAVVREDLEDWLDENEWSARTRRNKLTFLTTFYKYAIGKSYCTRNPAEFIPRPKVDDEPIGILTPEESKDLLYRAVTDRAELVGAIAIAAFAGLRRSELCALDWEEVNLEDGTIEVKSSKAKTRQRRVITINPTLRRWLLLYGGTKGPVTVTRNADVWGEWVRKLAAAAGIKTFPKNALRHGFGSYYFALIKDENRTAAEMGNSPDIVFRHYRALVGNEACRRFWAIVPPSKSSKPSDLDDE